MSRILEYRPSGEQEVVSRILINVHRKVDEHFPGADRPPRQFVKTQFADGENTAIVRAEARSNEAPLPPPPSEEPSLPELPAPPQPKQRSKKEPTLKQRSQWSEPESTIGTQTNAKADTSTREIVVWAGILIAGLIALIYFAVAIALQ